MKHFKKTLKNITKEQIKLDKIDKIEYSVSLPFNILSTFYFYQLQSMCRRGQPFPTVSSYVTHGAQFSTSGAENVTQV